MVTRKTVDATKHTAESRVGGAKATEGTQTMRRIGVGTDKLTQKKQDEGSDRDEAAAVTDHTEDTRRTKCGSR